MEGTVACFACYQFYILVAFTFGIIIYFLWDFLRATKYLLSILTLIRYLQCRLFNNDWSGASLSESAWSHSDVVELNQILVIFSPERDCGIATYHSAVPPLPM